MILPAKLLRTALLTTALAAVCTIGASAASLGVGTVEADALRLREEAGRRPLFWPPPPRATPW